MRNEDTPKRIAFLLERAKDGNEFYFNNIRHYFGIGGILMECTNEIIEVEYFGIKSLQSKNIVSKMTIYELCNPLYELTEEPVRLDLSNFVSLHKEMN